MIFSYCKIFINGPNNLEEIFEQVKQCFSVLDVQKLNNKSYDVDTDYLYISIDDNPDFDSAKLDDPVDGFLFYPFIIESSPFDDMEVYENIRDAELYIKNVSYLINYMRKKGYDLVPACEFEDYLNKPILSEN